MKYVDVVSERDFDSIARDIADDAKIMLWEMWCDDLNTDMHPHALVNYANALLVYFGSKVAISDVQWDDAGNCFLWEIQYC